MGWVKEDRDFHYYDRPPAGFSVMDKEQLLYKQRKEPRATMKGVIGLGCGVMLLNLLWIAVVVAVVVWVIKTVLGI